MTFTLSTAINVSPKFWYVTFLFLFSSKLFFLCILTLGDLMTLGYLYFETRLLNELFNFKIVCIFHISLFHWHFLLILLCSKPTLCMISNVINLLSSFMTHDKFSIDECSIYACTWKESLLCFCWVKCSIKVDQV